MLPPFDPDTGRLPEGEHVAPWDEVVDRLGWTSRRRRLLDGLAEAIEMLEAAGCRRHRDRRTEMITNEVQYRATKSHLEQFEAAAANLEASSGEGKRTKLHQLEIDAVRSQADDLQAELSEYERLRTGEVSTFEAASLDELATLLVKARIARGWTQRRLAEALGVAEQQVQRYEASAYRSTSLARLCDVAEALDVTFTERAELRGPNAA